MSEMKEIVVNRYIRSIKKNAEACNKGNEKASIAWEARIAEIETLYFQLFGESVEYIASYENGEVVFTVIASEKIVSKFSA